MGVVGVGAGICPLIRSMNPADDVLALSTVDVDISAIQPGQSITVLWRGKPVFIRHRTEQEIEAARNAPLKSLIDPQTDEARVKNPEWLVVVGVCTHLGCIPTQRKAMSTDDAGGWLCSCHGSRYDTSGRVIVGPAPQNLPVPTYKFLNDGKLLRIGDEA
jgi:ubiquinol-cytochrome c reductase iron-sulfur subunit